MNRILPILIFAWGCGSPLHLQYDHGRASSQAFSAQGDLSRPSAAADAYPLSGTEGIEIRSQVFETSTDAESGKAEYVQEVSVQ